MCVENHERAWVYTRLQYNMELLLLIGYEKGVDLKQKTILDLCIPQTSKLNFEVVKTDILGPSYGHLKCTENTLCVGK